MGSVRIQVQLTAGTPQQKIINFYTNNSPPVQIGKRWYDRLVIDHLFHDEIEKEVNKLKQNLMIGLESGSPPSLQLRPG